MATLKSKLTAGVLLAVACIHSGAAAAEDRSIDGWGNDIGQPELGAAGQPLIRRNYNPTYANNFGAMISDYDRTNARTLSNTLGAQTASVGSARGLSNYLWAWGQFLDHDMDLSITSSGAGINGSAAIAVQSGDPLGPNPIAMTRDNFVIIHAREQVNEVSAYIDGSQIYGSNGSRAATLRVGGGTGAKLATSANNLLPYNTSGLTNQNNGPTPGSQLFLAGDIRANENLLLTSMQTVFMREHNRLVDVIHAQQPALDAEQQYQFARKLVGAEIEAITYKEFLPALMGNTAPTAQGYHYTTTLEASITNSFAHSAFRFGHSALTSSAALVNSSGVQTGTMSLGSITFNPNQLTGNPGLMNDLLRGAAGQLSEEIDLKHVDAIRNVMFGPPGAGGTDLFAIDIQRGRDHGLPDYNTLRAAYGLAKVTSFSQITSNATVRQALITMYGNDIDNIDSYVGGLAEDHVAGSSLGALFQAIIGQQFLRTRDADRLFYRSPAAGLYAGGVLSAQVASIVNLNTLTLSDVIEANTGITGLQNNVFFTALPGDFNHDGYVNGGDLQTWRTAFAGGTMSGNDFLTWQRNYGAVAPWAEAATSANVSAVPEPTAAVLVAILAAAGAACRRVRR